MLVLLGNQNGIIRRGIVAECVHGLHGISIHFGNTEFSDAPVCTKGEDQSDVGRFLLATEEVFVAAG
jgi:hypothetical protein